MNVSPWLRYHTKVCNTLADAIKLVGEYKLDRKTVIYLCGGINGLSDSACKDWREQVKAALPDAEFLDPMRRDYRGREDDSIHEIVVNDKNDIIDCDIVIANTTRPSWGTAMEILYAWENGRLVVSFMSL